MRKCSPPWYYNGGHFLHLLCVLCIQFCKLVAFDDVLLKWLAHNWNFVIQYDPVVSFLRLVKDPLQLRMSQNYVSWREWQNSCTFSCKWRLYYRSLWASHPSSMDRFSLFFWCWEPTGVANDLGRATFTSMVSHIFQCDDITSPQKNRSFYER